MTSVYANLEYPRVRTADCSEDAHLNLITECFIKVNDIEPLVVSANLLLQEDISFLFK